MAKKYASFVVNEERLDRYMHRYTFNGVISYAVVTRRYFIEMMGIPHKLVGS